jgi:RND family efflux transporter MFP subunit
MKIAKATLRDLTLFFIFIAPLLFCGCEPSGTVSAPPAAIPPPAVKTVHPHPGDVCRYINLPGEVHPLFQVTLFAKVDGYLDTLTVDKGDSVKAGDLIADIDVPELRANKIKDAAELELAEAEFKQISEAATNNPVNGSPEETEAAKNRIALAQSRLAVAKGNLEYVESMLQYARITAPFDGIITKRYVDPGAYIPVPNAAATPEAAAIVNLTDLQTLRLQVAVPETEASHIHIGQPIRWTTDDFPGQNFDGTVTRAYWALDEATRTMLTEDQMENPGMKLMPGMLVNARISIEKKQNVLLVPVAALDQEKENSFVFIFDSGRARKTPVQAGFNDGTNVEIMSGVKPGDLVILAEKQTIMDGQSVKIADTHLTAP